MATSGAREELEKMEVSDVETTLAKSADIDQRH